MNSCHNFIRRDGTFPSFGIVHGPCIANLPAQRLRNRCRYSLLSFRPYQSHFVQLPWHYFGYYLLYSMPFKI